MIKVLEQELDKRWDESPDDIREAVFSPFYNENLEKVCDGFHLIEDKRVVLRKLCFLTFLGVIHLEDFYKEVKESLGVDSRVALDIYHEVDKKIFEPLRKEIDANYLKFKIGVVNPENIQEQGTIPQRVVLKRQEGSAVINLKPETEKEEVVKNPEVGPIRIEIKSEAPTSAPTPIPKPAPIQPQQPKVETPKPTTLTPTEASVEMGPVIIHKKEESQAISQTKTANAYKQASFGGYFGSFNKSQFTPKPQDTISRAQIETPLTKKPEETMGVAGAGERKIPVVVKKYEETPKTVHYSNFKTDLNKDSADKKIDLNKL